MGNARQPGAIPLLDSFAAIMREPKQKENRYSFSMTDPYEAKLGPMPEFPVQQRTYIPTCDQQMFLADELKLRGLPYDHVAKIKFVEGLDAEANLLSRSALDGDAVAVTQGNTIYVQPLKFDEVTSFEKETPFEEVYHTAEFASDGGADFYNRYGQQSVGGFLQGFGAYNGNVYERFAKGAAKEMRESYRAKKRKRW